MATFEFKLPDLGEGVIEGEIVQWLVKPGDELSEDQGIVELMTDKATVTVPSPKRGKVLRTHGKVGEMAKVHHALVDLETEAGVEASPRPASPAAAVLSEGRTQAAPGAIRSAPRVLATPVTRRMAHEHRVELDRVPGSGPQGRVLKSDVAAYLDLTKKSPVRPAAAGIEDERIVLRGLRKKIAEKMVRSKFTAPHYTFVEEIDASALVALRERLNASLNASADVKLSFLPFFVKALVAAFKRFPQVNATMDEATQELVVRGARNIGIATMTDEGLTVPVLRAADAMTLKDMAVEIARLAIAARDHALKLEEISQGTFTITSLGQTGGLFATPIINHPEVAILGIHRMRKRPVVISDDQHGDQIVVRPMMCLSFSFDHRVIDGATGADFAYEVIKYIERPELLLLDLK